MANTLVIFGGADAESAEARNIALQAGLATGTATLEGKPVHSGNAYKADSFVVDAGSAEGLSRVIIFECSPAVAGSLEVVARCDHHNPGDPGYGKGANEFFQASSLGQLMAFLGIEPTERQLLVAAADHCPADAYAGRCPGIDPERFAAFRVEEKVAFYAADPRNAHKASPEGLGAVIKAAAEKLQAAPLVDGVRDLREAGHVDELPEAALLLGEAYMAKIAETGADRQPTGNDKIVLGGHTTPEAVNAFMAWANSLPNKVGDAYGNPTRGFAGVVVKPA